MKKFISSFNKNIKTFNTKLNLTQFNLNPQKKLFANLTKKTPQKTYEKSSEENYEKKNYDSEKEKEKYTKLPTQKNFRKLNQLKYNFTPKGKDGRPLSIFTCTSTEEVASSFYANKSFFNKDINSLAKVLIHFCYLANLQGIKGIKILSKERLVREILRNISESIEKGNEMMDNKYLIDILKILKVNKETEKFQKKNFKKNNSENNLSDYYNSQKDIKANESNENTDLLLEHFIIEKILKNLNIKKFIKNLESANQLSLFIFNLTNISKLTSLNKKFKFQIFKADFLSHYENLDIKRFNTENLITLIWALSQSGVKLNDIFFNLTNELDKRFEYLSFINKIQILFCAAKQKNFNKILIKRIFDDWKNEIKIEENYLLRNLIDNKNLYFFQLIYFLNFFCVFNKNENLEIVMNEKIYENLLKFVYYKFIKRRKFGDDLNFMEFDHDENKRKMVLFESDRIKIYAFLIGYDGFSENFCVNDLCFEEFYLKKNLERQMKLSNANSDLNASNISANDNNKYGEGVLKDIEGFSFGESDFNDSDNENENDNDNDKDIIIKEKDITELVNEIKIKDTNNNEENNLIKNNQNENENQNQNQNQSEEAKKQEAKKQEAKDLEYFSKIANKNRKYEMSKNELIEEFTNNIGYNLNLYEQNHIYDLLTISFYDKHLYTINLLNSLLDTISQKFYKINEKEYLKICSIIPIYLKILSYSEKNKNIFPENSEIKMFLSLLKKSEINLLNFLKNILNENNLKFLIIEQTDISIFVDFVDIIDKLKIGENKNIYKLINIAAEEIKYFLESFPIKNMTFDQITCLYYLVNTLGICVNKNDFKNLKKFFLMKYREDNSKVKFKVFKRMLINSLLVTLSDKENLEEISEAEKNKKIVNETREDIFDIFNENENKNENEVSNINSNNKEKINLIKEFEKYEIFENLKIPENLGIEDRDLNFSLIAYENLDEILNSKNFKYFTNKVFDNNFYLDYYIPKLNIGFVVYDSNNYFDLHSEHKISIIEDFPSTKYFTLKPLAMKPLIDYFKNKYQIDLYFISSKGILENRNSIEYLLRRMNSLIK